MKVYNYTFRKIILCEPFGYCGEKLPLPLDYVGFNTHCLCVLDCTCSEDKLKPSTVVIEQGFE